jgi:hypothetical protein
LAILSEGGWKNSCWKRAAGKLYNRGMEEASENGKEWSHSAHANGMHKLNKLYMFRAYLMPIIRMELVPS